MDITIRGLYTQVNPAQLGFEQNVNVYVDGVYMGKQFSANADLGPRRSALRFYAGPRARCSARTPLAAPSTSSARNRAMSLKAMSAPTSGSRDLNHFKGDLQPPDYRRQAGAPSFRGGSNPGRLCRPTSLVRTMIPAVWTKPVGGSSCAIWATGPPWIWLMTFPGLEPRTIFRSGSGDGTDQSMRLLRRQEAFTISP